MIKRRARKLYRHLELGSVKHSGLFMDLDGTLWPDSNALSPFQFNLDKETKRCLKVLRDRFKYFIVLTNQTYGARRITFPKLYTTVLFFKFNLFLFRAQNIDAVYICIHHPKATKFRYRENCSCRKPLKAMFESAIFDYGIDCTRSVAVGDRVTDLMASHRAGIKTNFLIVNPEMFQLNISTNAEVYTEMPIFKFIDSFLEIGKIETEENYNFGTLQVLYLAAGVGRRLRPLTDSVPKPMLSIAGEPIVKLLVEGVHRHIPSASHIINISHLAHKFASLDSRKNSNINLSFSYEHVPVGSVKTLYNLAHKSNFEKDILVIHGDLVLGEEYLEALANILKNAQQSIIFGHHRLGFAARSSIVLDIHKKVVSFSNEPQLDEAMHIVNSGIYYFRSQDLKNAYSADLSGEISDTLAPILIQKSELECRVIDLPRMSIDSVERLNRAQEFFI